MSTFLILEMDRIHLKSAALVSPTILYSTMSLYIRLSMNSNNIVGKFRKMSFSTTHKNSHSVYNFLTSKYVTEIGTEDNLVFVTEDWYWDFLCVVMLTFNLIGVFSYFSLS